MLMLDIAKKVNMKFSTTLDYDNTVIETEKYDSEWTYKGFKGYQPGVAFLGSTPVYIEGRNGNTSAHYQMLETLQRCLKNLKDRNIPVKVFRSDAAAYQGEVCKLMESEGIEFFIRASSSQLTKDEHNFILKWDNLPPRNDKTIQLAETEIMPFVSHYSKKVTPPTYRLIVKKETDEDGKIAYYSIVTNNKTMSAQEVYYFYNKRGNMERQFDDLKNNFNWGRLPFSYMNENFVFMMIGAIAKIIYEYVIKLFSGKVDFVKPSHRLKKFRLHFITVSSYWTKKGILKLDSEKDYLRILS